MSTFAILVRNTIVKVTNPFLQCPFWVEWGFYELISQLMGRVYKYYGNVNRESSTLLYDICSVENAIDTYESPSHKDILLLLKHGLDGMTSLFTL